MTAGRFVVRSVTVQPVKDDLLLHSWPVYPCVVVPCEHALVLLLWHPSLFLCLWFNLCWRRHIAATFCCLWSCLVKLIHTSCLPTTGLYVHCGHIFKNCQCYLVVQTFLCLTALAEIKCVGPKKVQVTVNIIQCIAFSGLYSAVWVWERTNMKIFKNDSKMWFW